MRFLGSNGQIEITEYLHLLMTPFINNPLLESSTLTQYYLFDVCHHVCMYEGSVNPNKVIPLKVQQSFLYEISQLLKTIGDQLLPHVPSIFAIVFTLASHCAQLLSDYRDQVRSGQLVCVCMSHYVSLMQVASSYYSLLKNIRQSALNLVSEVHVL